MSNQVPPEFREAVKRLDPDVQAFLGALFAAFDVFEERIRMAQWDVRQPYNPDASVPMPQNIEQARGMFLLSHLWLELNDPKFNSDPRAQEIAGLQARVKELDAALGAMLQEFEKLARYGSPLAKHANEAVAAARAARSQEVGRD